MAAQPSKYILNLPASDHTTNASTLRQCHLSPELYASLLAGPAASTLDPLQSIFCQWPESFKKSINCYFLAFNSSRASHENHHNGIWGPTRSGPACPSNHSLCCPPRCYPLPTPASLFFLVHARHVWFPSLHSLFPGWNAVSSDSHIASFFPSFRCH